MRRHGFEKDDESECLVGKLRLVQQDVGEGGHFHDESLQDVVEVLEMREHTERNHLESDAANAFEEAEDETPDHAESIHVLGEKKNNPMQFEQVERGESTLWQMGLRDGKGVVPGGEGVEEDDPAVHLQSVALREDVLHIAGHHGLLQGLLQGWRHAHALRGKERTEGGPEPSLLGGLGLAGSSEGGEDRRVGRGDVKEGGRGRKQRPRVQPEQRVQNGLPLLQVR